MSSTNHPRHPKQRMMSQQEADAGRNLAIQINIQIQRNKAGFELTYDDLMCILSNQACFNAVLLPGLSYTDILDYLDSHRIYFELFLMHVPKAIPTGSGVKPPKPRKPKSNEKPATRSKKAKAQASERDMYQCIFEGTPYPPNAHIFPYAATRTWPAVNKTKDCFVVIQHKFGFQVYMRWYPNASKKGGFEMKVNLLGINERMHGWLDIGLWAFKFIRMYQSGTRYYVEVAIYWLPACSRKDGPAILDNGPRDSVTHVFKQLEAADQANFPPRTPAKGNGEFMARFPDGVKIQSGHIIQIPHDTAKEGEEFRNLIDFQWFGMFGLTLRGVTKDATPDDEGEDDDDDDDDDDDEDEEDDGVVVGKGKQKATPIGKFGFRPATSAASLSISTTAGAPNPQTAPRQPQTNVMPGSRQARQIQQASQAGPSGSGNPSSSGYAYGTIGRKSGRGGN